MSDGIKTTFIIIRHGETVANREGIFRGRIDFPLNDVGIEQAQALAKELSSQFLIHTMYSSPLLRSLKTAEIICEKTGNSVQLEEGLTNISLGEWEGQPKKEIAKRFPDMYRLWLTEPEKLIIPGAETIDDVRKRAVETIERIRKDNEGKIIAIVSHRAVLKPMLAGLLNISAPYFWRIHMDNASYSILTHTSERGWTLVMSNQTKHLSAYVVEEE